MERGGYIYIMSNKDRSVLYIGVTSGLYWRVLEHRDNVNCEFTSRYNCKDLIYYETFNSIEEAIKREKVLKKWKREWKDNLIKKMNPLCRDLAEEVKSFI